MSGWFSNRRSRRHHISCHFCHGIGPDGCECGQWSRRDQVSDQKALYPDKARMSTYLHVWHHLELMIILADTAWHRSFQNGQLIDYLPVMSDPDQNGTSRVHPRPAELTTKAVNAINRLSTTNLPTPFCRTCIANQALQMNLLANYLPSDDTEEDSGTEAGHALNLVSSRLNLESLIIVRRHTFVSHIPVIEKLNLYPLWPSERNLGNFTLAE